MTQFEVPEGFVACDESQKIFKKITKQAAEEKPAKIRPGSTVSVHYVGTLFTTGDKFDSSRDRDDQFSFKIGKSQVIKGWDVGVAGMKIGERADLLIMPEYGYGESGSPPKIPGNSILMFDVELFSVDESTADMTIREKIDACSPMKESGNSFFKKGEYSSACEMYNKAAQMIEQDTFGADEQEAAEIAALNIALHCNLAQVYLNMKEFKKAKVAAQKVVDRFDPGNSKAVYRLSQALLGMGEYEQAIAILEGGREKIGNVEAEIAKVKRAKLMQEQKERQTYSRMFA